MKIKFLKIKGTGHLRAKKNMGDKNELLREISRSPSISPVFFTSVLCFLIQPSLPKKYAIE
jgi:hypothetical protein